MEALGKERKISDSLHIVQHKIDKLMNVNSNTGEAKYMEETEYFPPIYVETEKRLAKPFASIHIDRFLALLDHCSGDKNYVNIESLRVSFVSCPEWDDLADDESLLYKSLNSPIFRFNSSEKSEGDRIDKDYLTLFGLLHCVGGPVDKANAFYRIISPKGLIRQIETSATTRRWSEIFEKLCKLSFFNIVYFTHNYTESVPLANQLGVM